MLSLHPDNTVIMSIAINTIAILGFILLPLTDKVALLYQDMRVNGRHLIKRQEPRQGDGSSVLSKIQMSKDR
jgi:hypothetical protein